MNPITILVKLSFPYYTVYSKRNGITWEHHIFSYFHAVVPDRWLVALFCTISMMGTGLAGVCE